MSQDNDKNKINRKDISANEILRDLIDVNRETATYPTLYQAENILFALKKINFSQPAKHWRTYSDVARRFIIRKYGSSDTLSLLIAAEHFQRGFSVHAALKTGRSYVAKLSIDNSTNDQSRTRKRKKTVPLPSNYKKEMRKKNVSRKND